MLTAIKSAVQSSLGTMGLRVQKIRREPYEELWKVPRYTQHQITLLGRPFTIADSRSFFFSYREIFVEEIYRFNSRSSAPRIIDCGSNYGTSVVYFKNLYPLSRVTGVEADPNIFKILRQNCAHLDVELLNKAVTDSREPVTFFVEGSDGGRTARPLAEPKTVVKVDATTLDDLIDGPIDFLKIDIEGSEGAATDVCTKLDLVNTMFIEYHCFEDCPQTLDRLLQRLTANGFRYYIRHQFCSVSPLTQHTSQLGMDLQLNIFAIRRAATS